jgi:hypothetical protein
MNKICIQVRMEFGRNNPRIPHVVGKDIGKLDMLVQGNSGRHNYSVIF